MSELNKLVQDFLIYQHTEDQAEFRHVLLMEVLNQRGLDKLFLQQYEITKKALEEQPYRDVSFHYLTLRCEEEIYGYFTAEKRSKSTNLKSLVNQVDYHFLYRKLKFSCEILNRQHIVSGQYENIPLLEPILNHLKKVDVGEIPGIRIYLQTLYMLQEPDNENRYHELKALLIEHIHSFSPSEMKDMFMFAQNYCIRKANKGDKAYLEELFSLQEILVREDVLAQVDRFSQFDFNNMSKVALRLEKFEWLEDFTNRFVELLPIDIRTHSFHLNLASIAFSRGDFRQALRELLKVDSKDIYFQLAQKALLLKIYYELTDVEPFISLVESFRKFLSRNTTIAEYHYTVHYNLIKFTKQLFECKSEGKHTLADIKAEIASVKEIAELIWLEKKVAELEAAAK